MHILLYSNHAENTLVREIYTLELKPETCSAFASSWSPFELCVYKNLRRTFLCDYRLEIETGIFRSIFMTMEWLVCLWLVTDEGPLSMTSTSWLNEFSFSCQKILETLSEFLN